MASISPGALPADAWSPQTQAERDSVLRQLDRILHSRLFRSSKRNPALLKYIVEQTLDGHGDAMKERILGVEVFGREPDYDTNLDHVVRTAAGEVRKRLAQYYVQAGAHDEIRIEVPPGAYVAQFRLAREGSALTDAAPAPEAEGPVHWLKGRAARLFLVGSLVANAVLAVVLILGARPSFRGASTLEKFWDPVFAGSRPVLICVGLQHGSGAPKQPAAESDVVTLDLDPLMRGVYMADLLALSRVAAYAGERNARFRVADPASTSFSDLQDGPTILIGFSNNPWTTRIADRLRYGFVVNRGNRTFGILDKRNPGRKDWLWSADPAVETTKDYAIVSRLLDRRVEQVVVIVGGLGPHGTEAAGQFITDPEQIKKVEPYAPSGWARKNLQVVLSAEVVKGSSGPPKIEAAYFW
jgi:hypothetical protein